MKELLNNNKCSKYCFYNSLNFITKMVERFKNGTNPVVDQQVE